MEGGKIYATYTVDYTRYMPSLPDGKSWKERINYDLVLSTDNRQIISLAQKDEQYFLHHRSSDLQLLNSLPGENERDESAKQLKSVKSVPNVDRDAIVRYAYRYVFDHNPEYVDFTYPNHQDCTNFVSQALHAGGWQKNWEWTANDVQATASWAVANDFDAYAWRQGYVAEAYPYTGFIPPSGMRSVRQGDIMLYSTDDSTTDHITWQHAMIVTSFYNYEPYLTYHSNDIRDKPYSAVIAAVPWNAFWDVLNVTPYA